MADTKEPKRTDTTKTPLKTTDQTADADLLAAASAGAQPQSSAELADQDPSILEGNLTPEQRVERTREQRDAAGMDQHNVPQDNEAVSMLPALPGEFSGKAIDPRVIPDEVWEANPGYDRGAAIKAWDATYADQGK